MESSFQSQRGLCGTSAGRQGNGSSPACPLLALGGHVHTHLTHLPVEVLLQACYALKRVDVETYTAAGGMAETKRTHRSGWATRRVSYMPPTPPSPETRP